MYAKYTRRVAPLQAYTTRISVFLYARWHIFARFVHEKYSLLLASHVYVAYSRGVTCKSIPEKGGRKMADNGDYGVSGRKVRQLRLRNRMTQQELAHRAKLSVTQVSRIEKDAQTPRFSTVDRLAAALGVDPDDLIDLPALAS